MSEAGSILRGVADLIAALAWPVVVLLMLYVLILTKKGQNALQHLTSRLRRVKGPGFELELSEQAATQTREFTDDRFREFRTLVASEFDRQVTIFSIDEKHQRLVADHVIPVLREWGVKERDFRCTVHVPDILFTEALYQLLDYYGDAPGKRGRAFSVRFGIAGRAWRLGKPQVEGTVSAEAADLVRDWGMTWKEASGAGRGRHSFAAVPLQDEHKVGVGILYLDSTKENAFGRLTEERSLDDRAERVTSAIRVGVTETGLTVALGLMMAELRKRGPLIRVFEVGE